MASEIRVNKIENRSGLGTVTFADTGVDLAGIVTATTFSGSGASLTNLPAANVTGTLPAISGANLTNLPAANLTGALPAISGANLTGIAATDNVRTGILDVAGVGTFRNDVNIPDKIIHLGDTNTAIRFPAADTITAETGGSERARIDSAGRLGIGENSPSAQLHVSTPASTTCEIRLTSNNTGSGSGDRGRFNVYSALNDGTAYQAGYVDIDRSSGTDDIAHLLVALNDGSSVAERLRITGSGDLKFNSGFGSAGTAYGCRVWVYIDNTSGNMTLSGNGNVSSVSDNGAGSGQVYFSNAMPDTTYCVVSGLRRQGTYDMLNVNFSNSTGNFRYDSFVNGGGSNADLQGYAFAVFR